MNNISTGKKGEKLAIDFLRKKGYEILDTNWRFHHKEIDIIAKTEQNELVIVEVKTRKSTFFGEPEEAVDHNKQQFLIEATDAYIEEQNLDMDVRYDIIAIALSGERNLIKHIQEAFYPNF
jgi:putative endonuclease